jgi:hypothetical protein
MALCAILVGRSLLAEDSRLPRQGLPQGFRGEFLLVETTKGAVTVLKNPQLRTLDSRTYVVGTTVALAGVTDGELFGPTDQWVCLEDVRRMGEIANSDALKQIEEIAATRRDFEKKQSREREESLARSSR